MRDFRTPYQTQTGCGAAGSTAQVKRCWVLEDRKLHMSHWWHVAANKAAVTVTSLRRATKNEKGDSPSWLGT